MRVVIGWVGLAVFVVGAAALLLAWSANALPPGFFDRPGNVWPVALVLGGGLGLFLLLNSGLSASARPRPYIFDRGEARRGRLRISAGATDFKVSAHAPDMAEILAGDQAAGGYTPQFSADGGEAAISFRRSPLPLRGVDLTEVTLSPNVPWLLEVKSGIGNLDIDLFELSVPSVEVRGRWGDAHLIVPAAGATNAALSTWLGDARIEVPAGVAVKIDSRSGRFAKINVDERRWPRQSNGAWASPDFDTSPHRLTLNLKTTFGDLSVS